jgi:hypothetical protein
MLQRNSEPYELNRRGYRLISAARAICGSWRNNSCDWVQRRPVKHYRRLRHFHLGRMVHEVRGIRFWKIRSVFCECGKSR